MKCDLWCTQYTKYDLKPNTSIVKSDNYTTYLQLFTFLATSLFWTACYTAPSQGDWWWSVSLTDVYFLDERDYVTFAQRESLRDWRPAPAVRTGMKWPRLTLRREWTFRQYFCTIYLIAQGLGQFVLKFKEKIERDDSIDCIFIWVHNIHNITYLVSFPRYSEILVENRDFSYPSPSCIRHPRYGVGRTGSRHQGGSLPLRYSGVIHG